VGQALNNRKKNKEEEGKEKESQKLAKEEGPAVETRVWNRLQKKSRKGGNCWGEGKEGIVW